MAELKISSSPRATWVWAPDSATASRLRDVLDAGDHRWEAARRGRDVLPLVTSLDTGVPASEACRALAEAGFTFGWHDDQSPLNRTGWPTDLPGMPA